MTTQLHGQLLIVDDTEVLHGQGSAVRELLAYSDQHVFGIVLVDSVDQLPASTETVVSLDAHGIDFEMWSVEDPALVASGRADAASVATATAIACALARFKDPDQETSAALLPTFVGPFDIDLPASKPGPNEYLKLAERWKQTRAHDQLRATIGLGVDGPMELDLVRDGPHMLVAGTTGAGKSEFLRTLVAALSSNHSPDDLVFVLIDYKGGSAFDACAALPHVVGMVTDLDNHLAERALISLEAELQHRERVLRDAAVSDISGLRGAGARLPRLVVVIDEFATLRAELPDFVTSLIGIAQRGRSLGVHLVLATQRPSGAVDANIRANTNLRIALRVQDAADSTDVIGGKDAADIAREQPGRAIIRRGSGDLVPVQTAFISGHTGVMDTPAVWINKGRAAVSASSHDPHESDLARFVEAATQAAIGYERPRLPWLPDLAERVLASEVDVHCDGDGDALAYALVDLPHEQRREVARWIPSVGHFAVSGASGSGVTTVLRTLIRGVRSDREQWTYIVDCGANDFADLGMARHVGAVLASHETTRIERLLAWLAGELAERKASDVEAPTGRQHVPIMVVIDGFAGFLDVIDYAAGGTLAEQWKRIARDGTSVGISIAAGAARPTDFGRSFAPFVREQLVLELADSQEYSALGLRPKSLPTFRPGRGVLLASQSVVQVLLRDVAGGAPDVGHCDMAGWTPPSITELSTEVRIDDLEGGEHASSPQAGLTIAIGVRDDTRASAFVRLRAGEHGLVAGPAGSGRTTSLLTVATQTRRSDPETVIVGIEANPDSLSGTLADPALVFDAVGSYAELEHVLEAARNDERRWLIVVDDADQIDLEQGPLWDFAHAAPRHVCIVASVHNARSRQAYGHWTRFIRASGSGVLLQPDMTHDGDLLGVRLPRRLVLPETPGRGVLVANTESTVIQLAR